jgi:hypothetical protein
MYTSCLKKKIKNSSVCLEGRSVACFVMGVAVSGCVRHHFVCTGGRMVSECGTERTGFRLLPVL